MDSRKLALICRELADEKKGENIVILDMRKVSSITDYFVVISAGNEPHLRAIADQVRDKLQQDHGLRPRVVDGSPHASWLVLDYFDVIIHIMKDEIRAHYDLETLWGDAPRVAARRAAAVSPPGKRPAARARG